MAVMVIKSPSFRRSASSRTVLPLFLSTLTLIGTYTAAVDVTSTLSYTTATESKNIKKIYETINDNKAIIAEYNDKFIVIDCYIEGENLVLLKGNYTIEDLTGVKIKRRKYEMIFTID